MRKALAQVLVAMLATMSVVATVAASENGQPTYEGRYFGDENWDLRCEEDMYPEGDQGDWKVNLEAVCHHMRSDMNGLDTPEVDVLIMVPVSPTAERDMRVARQSIEMWEAGIDYLAQKMDMAWLADGMNFHISVDYVDPNGGGGEFTTYPIVDPEIVVVLSNPVGGIGIGIDPLKELFGREGPCHGVANPFDMDAWEALPGFDRHHEERAGTYTEDCGGAGGNICFSVNGAIEPLGQDIVDFGVFDLISHEVGHCLSIGHVGDGAEGEWGGLPTNDIMAYHTDPPGKLKCVSTLDVESIATVMSRYLDTNGDGVLQPDVSFEDGGDWYPANDQIGDGRNPFQVQHPSNHFYASSTGQAIDCPQPDLGLTPGPRTNWTPDDGSTDQG